MSPLDRSIVLLRSGDLHTWQDGGCHDIVHVSKEGLRTSDATTARESSRTSGIAVKTVATSVVLRSARCRGNS